MVFTTSNFKVIFSVFTLLTLRIAIMSCSSSEYVCIKVKKSELMPDSFELSTDSLIVGGFKICKMAQRYYNKLVSMGGGGDSFTGFFIPPYLRVTEYGTYTEVVAPQAITLVCTGKLIGMDGATPIQVTIIATPNNIVAAMDN